MWGKIYPHQRILVHWSDTSHACLYKCMETYLHIYIYIHHILHRLYFHMSPNEMLHTLAQTYKTTLILRHASLHASWVSSHLGTRRQNFFETVTHRQNFFETSVHIDKISLRPRHTQTKFLWDLCTHKQNFFETSVHTNKISLRPLHIDKISLRPRHTQTKFLCTRSHANYYHAYFTAFHFHIPNAERFRSARVWRREMMTNTICAMFHRIICVTVHSTVCVV